MSVSAQDLAEQLTRLLPKLEMAAASVPAADAAAAAAPGEAGASLPPVEVCRLTSLGAEGIHLEVRLRPSDVVAMARLMDARGFAIDAVTGLDWPAQGEMEVVYDFFHPLSGLRVAARARVPRDNPRLPTIEAVFAGANWHERETHDFFGIRFEGHPNLTPLLLPDDATYHPLRKDFSL